MSFTYASVCDGIGEVHVAWMGRPGPWHPHVPHQRGLGWKCSWTSEIEPFPTAVVEHHFKLPNLGDMTRIDARKTLDEYGAIDLLVGGTPCQSFSVAGLRAGLADPRGNLALVFLRLVDQLRPKWVVWENVPGVLSSSDGRDFGSFLRALVELRYGFAYRVLDAQYAGVAQRRRRVFVVGHLGDWRRAAAVLLEFASFTGADPRQGEAPQVVANCLEASGFRFSQSGNGFTYILDDVGLRVFTPLEAERLQGFPDGYTDIGGADDDARWHALGNSMAVPCMAWIGRRIMEVEEIANQPTKGQMT